MKPILKAITALFCLLGFLIALIPAGASALEGQFNRPTYKNGPVRLDNCLHFGTSCGQPAADHYCQIKG